jgi:hypothetical protein
VFAQQKLGVHRDHGRRDVATEVDIVAFTSFGLEAEAMTSVQRETCRQRRLAHEAKHDDACDGTSAGPSRSLSVVVRL